MEKQKKVFEIANCESFEAVHTTGLNDFILNSSNFKNQKSFNSLKQSSGITLIALIITVIVLLILAGVTISLVVGDNGVLNQATNAAENHEREYAREQLGLALASGATEKYTNPNYNQYDFLDELVRSVTEGKGKTIGDVAIYNGYAFMLDRNTPKLGEYVGIESELVFPNVTATVQNNYNNTAATITIVASETTNGISKIEIMQDGFVIQEYSYENTKEEITENYEVKRNGNYYIKVHSKLTSTTNAKVEGLIMPVEYTPNGNSAWQKEHSVTLSASEEIEKVKSIKYQWTETPIEPAENTFTDTCNNGDTITKNGITGKYYLWTLLETESGAKAIGMSEVFFFDNQGPEVTLTSTPVDEASFTLNAEAQDLQSGISKYQFYVNNELKDTLTTTNISESYSATGLSTGNTACYVIVSDNAGNETRKDITAATKLYTWEKWSLLSTTTYVRSQTPTIVNTNANHFYGGTHSFSSSYTLLNNGYFKASSYNGSFSSSSMSSHIGCYMWFNPGSTNPNDFVSKYLYVIKSSVKNNQNYYWYDISYYRYTSEAKVTYSKGTTSYGNVTSASSSAYPTNGQNGSYWYVYKGLQ